MAGSRNSQTNLISLYFAKEIRTQSASLSGRHGITGDDKVADFAGPYFWFHAPNMDKKYHHSIQRFQLFTYCLHLYIYDAMQVIYKPGFKLNTVISRIP